jgi:hypothetical protein
LRVEGKGKREQKWTPSAVYRVNIPLRVNGALLIVTPGWDVNQNTGN